MLIDMNLCQPHTNDPKTYTFVSNSLTIQPDCFSFKKSCRKNISVVDVSNYTGEL